MKTKLINTAPKTFAIVFDSGDNVMSGLERTAQEQGLSSSSFTALGAFARVTLGFFDLNIKDYKRIEINEQVEVLSLVGVVALKDKQPKIHAHVVVGKADGTAHGGHLMEATVRPTLEVVLVEADQHLQRRLDPETGLALIDLTR